MAFTSHPGGATHEISRLRHPDAAFSRASGRVAGHLHAWPTPRSQARCRTRGPRLAPATRVNRRSPATLAMSSGLSRSRPPAALFRRLPAKDNLGYFAVTSRDFGAAACNAFSHCKNLQQYCSVRRKGEDDRHCCRKSARVRADHELCAVEAILHMAASNAAVMRRDVRATARCNVGPSRPDSASRSVRAVRAVQRPTDRASVQRCLPILVRYGVLNVQFIPQRAAIFNALMPPLRRSRRS